MKKGTIKIILFILAAALIVSAVAVLPAAAAELPSPPHTGDTDRFRPWIIVLTVSAIGLIGAVCLFFVGNNNNKKK